jgi:hypothetical protein
MVEFCSSKKTDEAYPQFLAGQKLRGYRSASSIADLVVAAPDSTWILHC